MCSVCHVCCFLCIYTDHTRARHAGQEGDDKQNIGGDTACHAHAHTCDGVHNTCTCMCRSMCMCVCVCAFVCWLYCVTGGSVYMLTCVSDSPIIHVI